ncbi:MAG: metallophosphoesterase [Parabacteroides sp.]
MRKIVWLCSLWCCCLFGIQAQERQIEPKEENTVRVMSYNIHNCIGMDDVMDFQRIAEVVNRVDPDLVAVQELDSVTGRNGGVYTLQELAYRTRMYCTFGASIPFMGGSYGIGILSKQAPLRSWRLPLPGREEARSLLVTEFPDYLFCCTHFSLTPEDQLASVPLIEEALKEVKKPVFLLGDMNSLPDSPVQQAMAAHFQTLSNTKVGTFPHSNKCIDYIYGLKNGSVYTVLNRRVLEDETMASDHLPLFADVRFPAKQEQIFRTKPYLQNPTDNGMTVAWFTNVPVHSWVEYGTRPDRLDQRQERIVDGQVICNNTHHKIRLSHLTPGQTYYYRVCSREITLYRAYQKQFGETVRSEVYSFTMPAADTHDFTALVFNDLHQNRELLEHLAQQIQGVKADFVIFNGDCIDDPLNESQVVRFLSAMNDRVGAEQRPVFYMRGNHEIRNAYSIQLRDLFDYVGNKTYGAFNWGDTRFVMMDCGEDKPDTTWVYYGLNDFEGLRKEQADFLRQELKNPSFKKATRRVLVNHIPLYGSGDAYQPCRALWGDLLAKAPFDLNISAHEHQFNYHPKGSNGNNFPVVIGGGNRLETGTVMILSKQGKTLTLKVLDAKGEVKQLLTF